MGFKFLGREPALWLAGVQALAAVLVGFQWDALSAEQASLWIAVINAAFGVAAGIAIRPVAPVIFTTAVSALAALIGAYGLDFTQEQVGSVNGLVLALFFLVTRAQASPAAEAHKTGVLGDRVTTEPTAPARLRS